MIIVTGATGRYGRRVVDGLLQRLPAKEIGVSVRDVSRAADLAERGVRVRRGDFAEPSSLADAFADASQVLIVSVNSLGDEARSQHRAAITAAAAAGASRVLYTSQQAAAPDSLFAPALDHAAAEEALEASGIAFTSLRNGFYANTVSWLLGSAADTGQLVAPADGPVAWTTVEDLADAAVVVLVDEGRLDGVTPPLTARRSFDLAEVAAIASELTGRPIERVVADDDDWIADQVDHGTPEGHARGLLSLFLASRRGEFAVVDPVLEQLLGRPAQTVREVLVHHLQP